MGSNAVDDLIEASSGVHYSGFHMEQPRTQEIEQPTTSIDDSFHKQPFIIGMYIYIFKKKLYTGISLAVTWALFFYKGH